MSTEETSPEANDDVVVDDEEFAKLLKSLDEEKGRLKKVEKNLKRENPVLAAAYGEMADTVLSLLREVTETFAGSIVLMENQLDELQEGTASHLSPDHAEKFRTYLEASAQFFEAVRQNIPPEQVEHATQVMNLIDAAKELTALVEEISEDDEEEEGEGADEDENEED